MKTLIELEIELKEVIKEKDKYLMVVITIFDKEQQSSIYEKLAKLRESEKYLTKEIEKLKK
jgi:hypothetical protein